MTIVSKSEDTLVKISVLREQYQMLERRCVEAEDALDAIRRGAVDALVIFSDEGEKIFTIQGAERTYRLMVESINEGAATLIDDGTILYCNHRFAEMIKMPLEGVIATSIRQYIPAEDQEAFSALFSQGLNGSFRSEINLLCGDGSKIPIMASLNQLNADGAAGVSLVASDLSEQKRTEGVIRKEALRSETLTDIAQSLVKAGLDEQAIMKLIIQSAAQLIGDACIILLVTPDGQWLNTAAHYHPDPKIDQVLGRFAAKTALYTNESTVRKILNGGEAAFFPTLDYKQLETVLKPALISLMKQLKICSEMILPIQAQDKAIGMLILVRLAGGNPYTQEDFKLAQRIANQMALAISNARLYNDLHLSLQKEQAMRLQLIQSEKLSALSRMMASVVHEINNPMQTIKNCMYLARLATPKDSQLAEYLSMASTETDRIGKLVSSLRDIYRPPRTEPMHPVDIQRLLVDIRNLMDLHLYQKNITWQQSGPGNPLWVQGMEDQLKQVFLNISLNAIEAMQPKGGTITISVSLDKEKKHIAVAIKDTGPGIEVANLSRVFEPFFTTKEKGNGLGLAICYEIIQRHEGQITIASKVGKGATFTICLPMIPPPGDNPAE